MLESVQKVIDLGVEGIKLHHLYVAQNTKLAELYKQNHPSVYTERSECVIASPTGAKQSQVPVIAMAPGRQKQSQMNEITTSPDIHRVTRNDKNIDIKLFTLEEYIPLVCDIIERLPAKMVIHRLTGELSGDYLIAPKWNVSKSAIIRMIEEELTKRGTYQGKKYTF